MLISSDGEFRHLGGDAGAAVELLGSSDELVWTLRRLGDAATVELRDVDGALVSTTDVAGDFRPFVATDQFVLGRSGTGLTFVRRD